MKPSEQGSFFRASRNESKEWYAMIKTYKNINISVEYQWFCMKPSEHIGRPFSGDGNFSFCIVHYVLYFKIPFPWFPLFQTDKFPHFCRTFSVFFNFLRVKNVQNSPTFSVFCVKFTDFSIVFKIIFFLTQIIHI